MQEEALRLSNKDNLPGVIELLKVRLFSVKTGIGACVSTKSAKVPAFNANPHCGLCVMSIAAKMQVNKAFV